MECVAPVSSGPPGENSLPSHEGDGKARAGVRATRLLLVEDDFFVGTELEYQLRAAGFEVIGVAATATEAIELAGVGRPDLAIMDIRLAGPQDGIEAATELKARYGVRSIFASAHSDAATQRRAEKAEPLGWLAKPYEIDTLIKMIERLLVQRH